MKKILVFFLITIMIVGCKKKYPDDNAPFHTRSPYKRLTMSEWKIKSFRQLYPNGSYPDCGSDMTCNFLKDGHSEGGCAFIYFAGAPASIVSYNLYFKGTWELINNDNNLKIVNDATHSTIWTIKQLDRKKMNIISDSLELNLER